MGNYTPNPFMTQPIYDPTRPFATPNYDISSCSSQLFLRCVDTQKVREPKGTRPWVLNEDK